MKILYAIQGTGNGHLSRAHDILPELQKYGNVDIIISGTDSELHLQYTIKYKYHGLGFFFGKYGGINILKTIFKLRLFRFIKDVLSLPVHSYDIVINDFEPITSWACKIRKKTMYFIISPNRHSQKNKSPITYQKHTTPHWKIYFKTLRSEHLQIWLSFQIV